MPNLEEMIEQAKARDAPPAVIAVVKPGEGALSPKPTRLPKVVAKKEKKAAKEAPVVEPPSKEELTLCRSICARMMKSVEHGVSLAIELSQLREMVKARGEAWGKYCEANIKNPKTGEPFKPSTIRTYAIIGDEGGRDPEKVTQLFYAHREKDAKKKKVARASGRPDTKSKKGEKNADAIQIFATWFMKGKVREDNDTVTVTFTKAEWNNVTSTLDKARGL